LAEIHMLVIVGLINTPHGVRYLPQPATELQ
jgi:hypothetical protein